MFDFLATPRTITCQAPLSMGYPRQEYWSGLLCLPPGDLPDPGIKASSPALQADSLPSEPPGKPYSLITQRLVQPGIIWFLHSFACLFSPLRIVIHNQQGPTVKHRELCSVLCGSLDGRGVLGQNGYMYLYS